MTELRFHNQLGDEYELFKLAVPHYDELEASVGELISSHFSANNIPEIGILELGFGTGTTSLAILNSDSRIKLTGVDNESLMLSKAEEKLSSIEHRRYTLNIGDALEYMEGNTAENFDVIASAWVIHNFTKEYRSAVIKQIYRLLKPGGLFINADKIEVTDRDEHAKNLEWQIHQFGIFEKIERPELKKEWTEHYLEDSKPDRALVESEFEREIKDTGFHSFQILKRWHNDALALVIK